MAQSFAVAFSCNGTKCAILLNLSTVTIIWVYPSDSGRAVIKSTEVDNHGSYGSSSGYNSPNFACLGDLFL